MKKVMIYIENYQYGGVETYVLDLIGNLNSDKEIILLTNHNNNFENRVHKQYPSLRIERVKIATSIPLYQWLATKNWPGFIKIPLKVLFFFAGKFFIFQNLPILEKELEKHKPDLVHIINGGYPGGGSCLAMVLVAKKRGIKTVMSVLSYPYKRQIPVFDHMLDNMVLNRIDILIPNSEAGATGLKTLRGAKKEKIRTIYTAIEDNDKHQNKKTRNAWFENTANGMTVVEVAAFEPYKNQKILIRAILQLKQQDIKVRCVLVGDGRTLQECKDLVEKLELGKEIKFTGYLEKDEVRKVMKAADIFVLPSSQEGLPYVIIEAMAMELPIISTRVGGIPELILNNKTGVLVAPENSEELADAIEYIIKNPKKAREMGRQARNRFLNNFTIDRMIKKTDEIYETLLRK